MSKEAIEIFKIEETIAVLKLVVESYQGENNPVLDGEWYYSDLMPLLDKCSDSNNGCDCCYYRKECERLIERITNKVMMNGVCTDKLLHMSSDTGLFLKGQPEPFAEIHPLPVLANHFRDTRIV